MRTVASGVGGAGTDPCADAMDGVVMAVRYSQKLWIRTVTNAAYPSARANAETPAGPAGEILSNVVDRPSA